MDEREIRDAAARFGTPFYCFDMAVLTARLNQIREAIGPHVHIVYAMKANPLITAAIAPLVDALEVCSPGEYRICERAGVPMEKIVLSGVHKEEADVLRAIRRGVGTLTVESAAQFALIARCAEQTGRTVRVLLRLTSGNQFGLDPDTLRAIVARRADAPRIRIAGIQLYSGTQKKKTAHILEELAGLEALCQTLKQADGFEAEEIEFGPGLSVEYFGEAARAPQTGQLTEFAAGLDAVHRRLSLEMGRFIAATCGLYVTAIADVKTNHGVNYCIVDGGIHHLNYYGQTMGMRIPDFGFLPRANRTPEPESRFTVCGSLCTVSDVVMKNVPLPGAQPGDLFAFRNAGAYSVTEGIGLFLSRDLPAVLLREQTGELRLLRGHTQTDPLNDGLSGR